MTHGVAIILPSLAGGGAERAMVDIAQGLIESGVAVELWICTQTPDVVNAGRVPSIRFNAKRMAAGIPELVRQLRSSQPAAVLTTMTHANIVISIAHLIARSSALLLLREASIPSVMSRYLPVHIRLLQRALAAIFYRRADWIIAPTLAVQTDVQAFFRVPLAQIRVIPNPIDVERLTSLAAVAVNHPWFADHREMPLILCVSRMSPARNLSLLVAAFAALRKERPARLAVLGDGLGRPEFETSCRKLGIENDVWAPGFVENPFCYMARSDVFVSTGNVEGFPNAIAQALAVGARVVSTDSGGSVRELLLGKAGAEVVAPTPDALVDGIERAIGQPKRPMRDRPYYEKQRVIEAYRVLLQRGRDLPAS